MKRLTALATGLCCAAFSAATVCAAEEPVNLALHKPYVMDPPGNCRYGADPMCTGPEDATDLSDGTHVRCKGGAIWFHKGAVGIWGLPQGELKLHISAPDSTPSCAVVFFM